MRRPAVAREALDAQGLAELLLAPIPAGGSYDGWAEPAPRVRLPDGSELPVVRVVDEGALGFVIEVAS